LGVPPPFPFYGKGSGSNSITQFAETIVPQGFEVFQETIGNVRHYIFEIALNFGPNRSREPAWKAKSIFKLHLFRAGYCQTQA